MEQGEDVIRYAAGICVVNEGVEAGWVAQKAVEHKWRFSCGRPVIPPFLMGPSRRTQAADFSFMAGVMPPLPMLGRSLL